MRTRLQSILAGCVACPALWPALLSAQAEAAPLPSATIPRYPRGEVVERVESRSDRQQHYAVYLPSRYSPARRWPLLLLMDPRGQALIPLALVQESAERLGYIVLSSYNSRSDEPVDPNRDALNAMLCSVGHNLRKILAHLRRLFVYVWAWALAALRLNATDASAPRSAECAA